VVSRRAFVTIVVGGCVLVQRTVRAQRAGNVYRIGYLHPATSQDPGGAFSALKQALAGLGYLVDRNLKFEERFADGKLERLPSLAAELVALRVDVIVAVSPSAIRAARDATATIPVVMAFSGDDPVKSGFVASLARPGGNITGMTSLTSELAPKWIELLQDAMPAIKRIAVLRSPVRPDHTEQVDVMQAAARPRAVRLQVVEARDLEQYGTAFEDMTRQRAEAVIILSGPEFAQNLVQLAELAAMHRLPSLWQYRDFVVAGGLLSYGPNIPDLSARAAVFVDKILKGANPGELPVQQPTKFELAINLKTAQAIGVTIPRSLLLRADEVIR
jgi:putative tryptophan/tyrosine transport system substrate-binding protein